MKTLAKIAGVAGLLIVVAFSGAIGKLVGKTTVDNYYSGKKDATITTALVRSSQEINKQLPMMVDAETRLDTTMAVDKFLMYKYTMVNYRASDFASNDFNSEIKPMLKENICKNEQMSKMLKEGVTYSYAYFGNDGILISELKFDKSACN